MCLCRWKNGRYLLLRKIIYSSLALVSFVTLCVFALSNLPAMPSAVSQWTERAATYVAFRYYLHRDRTEIEEEAHSGDSGRTTSPAIT